MPVEVTCAPGVWALREGPLPVGVGVGWTAGACASGDLDAKERQASGRRENARVGRESARVAAATLRQQVAICRRASLLNRSLCPR